MGGRDHNTIGSGRDIGDDSSSDQEDVVFSSLSNGSVDGNGGGRHSSSVGGQDGTNRLVLGSNVHLGGRGVESGGDLGGSSTGSNSSSSHLVAVGRDGIKHTISGSSNGGHVWLSHEVVDVGVGASSKSEDWGEGGVGEGSSSQGEGVVLVVDVVEAKGGGGSSGEAISGQGVGVSSLDDGSGDGGTGKQGTKTPKS